MNETVTIQPLEDISCLESSCTRANKEQLFILFVRDEGGNCTIHTGTGSCFSSIAIDEGANGYLLQMVPHRLDAELQSIIVSCGGLFVGRRTCIHPDAEAAEEMGWLLQRIAKRIRSKEQSTGGIVQKFISLLLLQLQSIDELVYVPVNRKGILLKGFFSLLEREYRVGRTVDHYAGKLCVSPKHLTNVIKVGSGFPTSYHINQRIVIEAKRMAQDSGASLKQIAYELGYDDVAAFSKLFKRVTGENFSAYKCHLRFAFAK